MWNTYKHCVKVLFSYYYKHVCICNLTKSYHHLLLFLFNICKKILNMKAVLDELTQFLTKQARQDLKLIALQHIEGLTASPQGIEVILQHPVLLNHLLSLLDDANDQVAKSAAVSLVNLSASSEIVSLKTATIADVIRKLLVHTADETSTVNGRCSMVLSNLTRELSFADEAVKQLIDGDVTLEHLVNHFVKNTELHYLAPVFANLAQNSKIREVFTDTGKNLIPKLLPFIEYKDSVVRRQGIAALLKNCCFDTDKHEILLSEDVDILPRLLLPLADNFEYAEEENDKLPLELQYLPEDKVREVDGDVRLTVIEALTQLCAKRTSREYLRDKNAYVILRELHKWEKNERVLAACENLVDILIRTEEEIGKENLKEIEVPEHLQEHFSKVLT